MTISTLEQLEQRFPFSRYAEQAQYDLMYAKFKNKDYEEVLGYTSPGIGGYVGFNIAFGKN